MTKTIRIIRRTLLIGFTAILLLAGLALVLSNIYEDELKAYVIKKIDEKFSAEINVKKIELSFWRKFPNASLRFVNISVKDAHIHENQEFFLAKNLYLQFSIYDILRHKYILKKVDTENGKINMLIYKNGQNNFNIFNDGSDTSKYFLSVEDFSLKNILFSFENQSSRQSYLIDLKKLKLPLEFSNQGFKCKIKGDFVINSYIVEGLNIIKNHDVSIDALINYENLTEKLVFEKSQIVFSNIALNIDGYLNFKPEIPLVDIDISSKAIDLNQLVALLPPKILEKVETYKIKGFMDIDLNIAGEIGGAVMPAVNFNFVLSKASLEDPNSGIKFNNLSLSGSFSNGSLRNLRSSYLKINSFKGSSNMGNLSGYIYLNNLNNLYVQSKINANLKLEIVQKLFKLESLETLEGKANVSISLAGNIKNLQDADLNSINIIGEANLQNCMLKLKSQSVSYSEINGKIQFDKEKLQLWDVNLKSANSSMKIQAQFVNYLNLAYNLNKLPFYLKADIAANEISFEQLMKIISFGDEESSPNKWIALINFDIDKFTWEKLIMNQAKGSFRLFDDEWSIDKYSFNCLGGKVNGDLNYRYLTGKKAAVSTNNHVQNIDVTGLFDAFNNFGQEMIKSNNIKGKISGDISTNFTFDAKMNVIPKSIKSEANIKIENGELLNVKELNALSNYTKIDDFSHIKFSTLTNNFTIADQKIVIPKMHVSSDKMDMDVFGTHNFENEYNYHLNILLSDILGKKLKPEKENEFGIIRDDGFGKTRIFLNIIGKGDKFEVKYDKKEVSAKIKEDVKKEGVALKQAIKEDFINEEKKNIRLEKRKVKEAEIQKMNKQLDGKFIIEWDEDSTANN